MENIKERLKSEAEVVVFEEIPKIITQLNELINSEKFSVNEKFAKIEISSSEMSENKTIENLTEIIRPIIMLFDQNVKLVPFVMQIMIDELKTERGDSYYNIIGYDNYRFDGAQKFADNELENIWKHFRSRSSTVVKLIENPNNEDLRRSLKELQISFIHRLRLSLVQTRNHYIQLHSTFTKLSKRINLALNPSKSNLLSSEYIK